MLTGTLHILAQTVGIRFPYQENTYVCTKNVHVHHEYEKRVMRILNEIKWDFDQGEYSSAVLRLRPLEVALVELTGITNKIADTYDQF